MASARRAYALQQVSPVRQKQEAAIIATNALLAGAALAFVAFRTTHSPSQRPTTSGEPEATTLVRGTS
jgi:hypothetical protein